jgi:hypothetical protein
LCSIPTEHGCFLFLFLKNIFHVGTHAPSALGDPARGNESLGQGITVERDAGLSLSGRRNGGERRVVLRECPGNLGKGTCQVRSASAHGVRVVGAQRRRGRAATAGDFGLEK